MCGAETEHINGDGWEQIETGTTTACGDDLQSVRERARDGTKILSPCRPQWPVGGAFQGGVVAYL